MKPQDFLAELRRRKVFKVGAAYLVVAWLVVQAASIGFPALMRRRGCCAFSSSAAGISDRGDDGVDVRRHTRGGQTRHFNLREQTSFRGGGTAHRAGAGLVFLWAANLSQGRS